MCPSTCTQVDRQRVDAALEVLGERVNVSDPLL